MNRFLPALLLALALALPAAGEITARRVEAGPAAASARLELERLAAGGPAEAVSTPRAVAAGDLLTGRGSGLLTEIACAGGSSLRLAGAFRLLIERSADGTDCAARLLAGEVEVAAAAAMAIQAGTLAVVTTGGRFAVRLERDEGAVSGELSVFEGAVRARAADGPTTTVLPGRSLRVTTGGEDLPPRLVRGEASAGALARSAELARRFGEGTRVASADAERSVPASRSPATEADPRPEAPALGAPPEPAPATEPGPVPQAESPASPQEAPVAPGPGQDSPAPGDSTPAAATGPAPADSAPADSTDPAPAPPELSELRDWIERGRHDEVIAALEPRLDDARLTSVDLLLLARAHAALGNAERASGYARRSLRLDEKDDLLTAGELIAAQNLRDAGR